MTEENNLLTQKHVFVYVDGSDREKLELKGQLEYLKANFCGLVVTQLDHVESVKEKTICYMGGDIGAMRDTIKNKGFELIYVIKELSYGYTESDLFVSLGQVPINVHNIGVYFREVFNSANYFDLISTEHQFQTLTESNKQSNAYRKGIYLSKVEDIEGGLRFNVLRCSTNFEGPTDNFRKTDNEIIRKVNEIGSYFFEHKTKFNHVLAQIYKNETIDGVEKKAKIKQHSDKTKDMPREGLIAFCTFYDAMHGKKDKRDMYNYCIGDSSVLTTLRFRLKSCVKDEKYVKKIDIVLYPNSVFIISLLTNRLYTHEIIPSPLPVGKIPTRMGYVIRCSNVEAVFKDGQTYLLDGAESVELARPDKADIIALKENYFKENMTADIIDYGKVHFSLNDGDYMKPNLLSDSH